MVSTMKLSKIMLIILLLCSISVLSLGCSSESESELPEKQEVSVQRGDIAIDITAVGNLLFSNEEELSFEVSGTVGEVLVEIGDSVKEGQVLVKLDSAEWEEHLDALESGLTVAERNLTTAERKLTSAERNLTTAERNLTTAERNLTSAERKLVVEKADLIQAQISLQTAESNLDAVEEVQAARETVEDAETDLKIAQARLKEALQTAFGEPNFWLNEVNLARARLTQAQQELAEVLADPDNQGVATSEVSIKKLQVELAEARLEQARNAVVDAEQDIADAEQGIADAEQGIADAEQDIADAEQDIADAQQTVADAQQELDEAKATSRVIVAPLDGLITRVNVSQGGAVRKWVVAVVLADPTKFEAAFMVGEVDILQVKLGGEAWVEVDALPGMSLPAKVTYISPTATIQSGVVNYRVKVEIESLQAIRQERQEVGREAMQRIAEGELPERLKQAIEEGRITQEQADAIIERIQQGELPRQPGQGGQPGQMSTPVPENFQLREGLTVTVSILVEARNDVLLVPNSAITSKEGQSYVQLLSPDGVTEGHPVTTGLSDWQFTEITEGLSEGDKVVITGTTTATTPTTSERQPQGGIRIPGMGGPR